mgnify:CR=1 FL=1
MVESLGVNDFSEVRKFWVELFIYEGLVFLILTNKLLTYCTYVFSLIRSQLNIILIYDFTEIDYRIPHSA